MMKALFSTLILFLATIAVHAQIAKNSELYMTLQKQDSIFFELGFNQCDIEYLEKTIAGDMKFFHDQGGFQDKKIFLENTKKYLCPGQGPKPIRKLEKGSLVVFPLYNNGALYGAIQNGVHHFYVRENGKEDVRTGTAKFTHVWVLENNTWKLSEVLSYDHSN